MKHRKIIFGAPLIKREEIYEVVDSLKSGWLGTGPKVALFENNFAKYKKAKHAIACNSCTAALHMSLVAAGVGPGDEVITTAYTYVATVNSIIYTGARPVLADVDPITFNIDPLEIEKRLTKKTKAIIPVHIAGRACEMDRILEIAKKYNLVVIEDAAHAIETKYKGERAGNFGRFGCYSFYVTKNVTTGEGGMVTCKTKKDAERLKILSEDGLSYDAWDRFNNKSYKHYNMVSLGFKYNMMDIQAALGLHQLKRIDQSWKKRQKIWNQYIEAFKNLPIGIPAPVEPKTKHAYHLFMIFVDIHKSGISRDQFIDKIRERGVGVGVHYRSIPEHPFYQKTYGWRPEDYPVAMALGRQTVSLPMSPKLTNEEVKYIIQNVKDIIENSKNPS